MSSSASSSSGGISVAGLLGVAFVVLKLTGHINWSWWYVSLPFWGGFALVMVFLAVIRTYCVMTTIYYRYRKARRCQLKQDQLLKYLIYGRLYR
ncbi:MAG: hypothetical protein LWW87_07265 [Geobacteraceae bacterium]|nr:hypothetical protein [Geobacteraceae bacterium]